MPWTFETINKDGTPGYSSSMTKGKAVAFARDLLASGIRVVKMESTGGETLVEDEIRELCRHDRNVDNTRGGIAYER